MPTPPPAQHDGREQDAIPAYILAGGRSLRFGSDKALAEIDSVALIRRVADGLRQVAGSVVAVAQQDDAYARLGLQTIADAAPDCGPVQGLLAAMVHRLETGGPGWLLLAACDMLPTDTSLYDALIDNSQPTPPSCLALARYDDRWHPLPGLYHTALLPLTAAYLADDGRSFQGLLNKPDAHAAALYPTGRHGHQPAILHATTPKDLGDDR